MFAHLPPQQTENVTQMKVCAAPVDKLSTTFYGPSRFLTLKEALQRPEETVTDCGLYVYVTM